MAGHVEVDETVLKKIAQSLAANEKNIRDRAVKKLRKWLTTRSQGVLGAFTEEDMLKIWKGLHYSMWMSDKPLVQEDLAETIASLIQCFHADFESAVLFIDTFLKTEAREWFGIDRLRLDKFMMLIRKFVRESFTLLQSRKWKKKEVKMFAGVLSGHVISSKKTDIPQGLQIHMTDIFLTELEKTTNEKLTGPKMQQLLEPFCVFLAQSRNKNIVQYMIKTVFLPVANYPTWTTQNEGNSDDEPEGLKVDHKLLADRLFELASDPTCISGNRKSIYRLVKMYRNMSKRKDEQERKFFNKEEFIDEDDDIEKAVRRLQKFEMTIMEKTKKNIKKRKKGDHISDFNDESDHSQDEPPVKRQKTISVAKVAQEDKSSTQKLKERKQKKNTAYSKEESNKTGTHDQSKLKKEKRKGSHYDTDQKETATKKNKKIKRELLLKATKKDLCTQEDKEAKTNQSGKKEKLSKYKQSGNVSEVPVLTQSSQNKGEDTKSLKNISDVEKDKMKGENSEPKNKDFDVPKADIVVPSKRGKLKNLVHQSLVIEKPSIRVTTDESADNSSNEIAKFTPEAGQDSMVSLFSGGFVDDSDEETTVKKKNKTTKKKRKSLPAELSKYTEIKENSVLSKRTTDQDNEHQDQSQSNNVAKFNKKLKRKSTGSIRDTYVQMQSDEKASKSSGNKQVVNKGKGEISEEVEIVISKKKKENAKCRGQSKSETDPKSINVASQGLSNGITSNCHLSNSPFASFDSRQKTPRPVFVKKAHSKRSPQGTPNSNPKKSAQKRISESSGRRVSFVLHKNTAHEFKESLQPSPIPAFDPKVTPNQGILKSSPASLGRSPSSGFSPMPKMNLEKEIYKKKRPRAEDFF